MGGASSREASPTPEERRDTRMMNMQESMMKEQRIALEGKNCNENCISKNLGY